MTSFESIDRLRHHPPAPSPQFLDGAVSSGRPLRRLKEEPLVTVGGVLDLSRGVEVTRQLTQAQEMEAISRVTGGIAHNFNNLLTGIMGFCDLLATENADRATEGRYLEMIMDAATRGGDLVRQLLAFSQEQLLDPGILDVNRAATDCEPLLRQMAGERVEVVFDLDGAPGLVRADPKQIDRVILNLAANALEAMAEGGRLTLRTRHLELDGPSISHLGIPTGCYVLLEVAEPGAGFDEAM